MNYKNIIFDLGNVLVKLDEDATMQAFENLGMGRYKHLRENPEALKLFQAMGIGMISNQDFFNAFRRIVNPNATDKQITDATNAMLITIPDVKKQKLMDLRADTKETERYVSAMAVATPKSALSFSYLATALPIVGPVAKAFNFTIEDTLALVGKLADSGFDASMSATATRNILLNLADTNGVLGNPLGGPVKTLPELVIGLQKLKEQGVDLNTTLEMTDKRSVAAFNAFLTAAVRLFRYVIK